MADYKLKNKEMYLCYTEYEKYSAEELFHILENGNDFEKSMVMVTLIKRLENLGNKATKGDAKGLFEKFLNN